jgi:protein-disulfide isomerase-like protein with CxxC motif
MAGVPRPCFARTGTRPVGVGSWCAQGIARHTDVPGFCDGRSLRDDRSLPRIDRSTLLVFVVDVYDPRAYDYLPSVSAVLAAASSQVEIEVVQAERYAGPLARAGVIALLAAEAGPPDRVLAAVQRKFFVEGRGLDEDGVLAGVAEGLGLDAPAVELFARSDRAAELVQEDAALALDLDLAGGPLLLASRGNRVYEFDGPGASGERLVDQFRSVIGRRP